MYHNSILAQHEAMDLIFCKGLITYTHDETFNLALTCRYEETLRLDACRFGCSDAVRFSSRY